MKIHRMLNSLATGLLAVGLAITSGCGPESSSPFPVEAPPRKLVRRVLTLDEVQGPLTNHRIMELYGVPDFVYAQLSDTEDGRVVTTFSYASSDDMVIDDDRLMIYVGGSGDAPDGFYHTAKLIAASPLIWDNDHRPLLIVTLHWSESRDPVTEHTNLAAQESGALRLQQMAQVHDLRHRDNPQAHVSVMAFSAGSRVVQLAYGCAIEPGNSRAVSGNTYPEEMNSFNHIIFLGSSLPRDDPLPFENIRGRFINFVNPRDTHFGDRASHIAPPGVSPSVPRFLSTRFVNRSPGSGASASGFDGIATLVSADQFIAADYSEVGRQAFRMVNVAVPSQLAAYGLFGIRLDKDDLDDFINAAPNHYIMMGRGPGGALDGELFDQYRDIAEEFVQFVVAPALVTGRVLNTVLLNKPQPLRGVGAVRQSLTMPLKVVEPVFARSRSSNTEANPEVIPMAQHATTTPDSTDTPAEQTADVDDDDDELSAFHE